MVGHLNIMFLMKFPLLHFLFDLLVSSSRKKTLLVNVLLGRSVTAMVTPGYMLYIIHPRGLSVATVTHADSCEYLDN